jgi:hypothetical protein
MAAAPVSDAGDNLAESRGRACSPASTTTWNATVSLPEAVRWTVRVRTSKRSDSSAAWCDVVCEVSWIISPAAHTSAGAAVGAAAGLAPPRLGIQLGMLPQPAVTAANTSVHSRKTLSL